MNTGIALAEEVKWDALLSLLDRAVAADELVEMIFGGVLIRLEPARIASVQERKRRMASFILSASQSVIRNAQMFTIVPNDRHVIVSNVIMPGYIVEITDKPPALRIGGEAVDLSRMRKIVL